MTTFYKIGGSEYNAGDYQIPAETTFRDSWAVDTDASIISVNMSKAKDIWRERIRLARKDEFARLDTEFMKAMETGADTTSIVAQKQVLRDAPAHADIDAATTPDELKAVQPIPNVTVE